MEDAYILTSLRRKRAEIAGEISQTGKRLIQLRADLVCIDGAIRIFDPSIAPDLIRPIVRLRKPENFRRYELTRLILAILRDANAPLTIHEIATQAANACGLKIPNARWLNALATKVRVAVLRQNHGTLLSEKGLDGTVSWRAVKP